MIMYRFFYLLVLFLKEMIVNNLYNIVGYNIFGSQKDILIGVVNVYISDYFCQVFF